MFPRSVYKTTDGAGNALALDVEGSNLVIFRGGGIYIYIYIERERDRERERDSLYIHIVKTHVIMMIILMI